MTKIREEGLGNSKVMETLAYLCDVIGPRLTASPAAKQANDWTRQQLESWGLANAHLEPWGPFGRGWSMERVSVHMVAPTYSPLVVVPKAWSPGTKGAVRAEVVRVEKLPETDAELAAWKGKLSGKVVLTGEERALQPLSKPLLTRYSDEELHDLAKFEFPGQRRYPFNRETYVRRLMFRKTLDKFLMDEGVVAVVEPSSWDRGVVRVGGTGIYDKNEPAGVCQLVMAAEHYNRIARLVDRKMPVTLEVDVKATFHDGDGMGYNTVAEIPGTDKRDEIVMCGAHLDSWHAGTGATDNAAGVAVAMEAMRILKSIGVTPRRTIRVALWTGEEQGLLGSRDYVKAHFASRPEPTDPEQKALPSFLRRPTGPLAVKPEHAKVAGYFNLDNGTGKIRGIYAEGNAAVGPIFAAWLAPFADLGATTVTMRDTGGTDHQSFDGVGIPGFQFIQDEVEYSVEGAGGLTHHSNMDVYDRLQREDMMQAAVVMAAFLYDAAMRDEMLPRKPLPQ
jgi:hypothetical protein